MSTKGCYELVLSCDQPQPKGLCGTGEVFVKDTRMEALEAARSVGWLISKSRTAFCPVHADERRASWR